MRAAMKRRWVEALRSGEYKQGHGRLMTQSGHFCCLGVLADLEVDDDWVWVTRHGWMLGQGVKHMETPDYGIFGDSPGKALLGKKLAKELGLTETQEKDLAELNDNNKDFNFIADYIEENL